MKKRLMASLFVCMFSLTLIPTASAAGYTPPSLPDVFQGDGLYITAVPFKPEDGWIVEDLEPFHDGYIRVGRREEVRDSHGYLTDSYGVYNLSDRNGNIVLDYSGVVPTELYYGDGMCLFYDELTKLWGYMDMTGNVIIEPQFADANVFSDGLAAVKLPYPDEGSYDASNPGIGYIDKTGEMVIGPFGGTNLSDLGYFSDGLAPVDISPWAPDDNSFEYYEKLWPFLPGSDSVPTRYNFYGHINKQGEPVITLHEGEGGRELSDMLHFVDTGSNHEPSRVSSQFSEGYAILEDSRGDRRYPAYVVIDTKGNEVGHIDPDAPMAVEPKSVVRDGLIVMDFINTEGISGEGIGAVDIHGNTVIEPGANIDVYGTYFDSGVARGSGGTIVIDKQGNTVIPNSFTAVTGVDPDTLLAEVRMAYDSPSVVVDFSMTASHFNEGLALLTVNMRFNGMSDMGKWYYLLESHEGTYTGPGKVYNAATGQITGGASASQPGSPARPAADQPSSWAAGQVDEAVSAGIVPENLRSAYGQSITRAEFCALATRLYETVKGTAIAERVTFTDTTDENVEKMAALGVVTGTGDGAFDPGGLLTREQAATMLARLSDAVGAPLPAGSPTFPDAASISSWASEAVGRVQAGGVMSGTDTGAFDPAGPYTREQSILTMLRLYHTI